MTQGFYFRNWRIWEEPRSRDIHLERVGQGEIIFSGNEISRVIELLIRIDNCDFIPDVQVHSTEEEAKE